MKISLRKNKIFDQIWKEDTAIQKILNDHEIKFNQKILKSFEKFKIKHFKKFEIVEKKIIESDEIFDKLIFSIN